MSSSAQQTNADGASNEKNPSRAAPARILLVDDDPVNQMVALGLLRRHGWEAVSAANGKEALNTLAGQSFDLILMDLQMPEMDGFQTASVIRQNEAKSSPPPSGATAGDIDARTGPHGRVPIIALTTASQAGVREKCLAAGMDDYVTKPVNPRDLYAIVEKYLAAAP
jgi:CheY-like chemotaxis protein